MQEPILEALTFSLESDLMVGNEGGSDPNKHNSQSSSCKSSAIVNANGPVQCLMPNCDFISNPISDMWKVNESNILEHLLRVHHFVIDNVEQVANIHKYFAHWRERFQGNKLEEFCVVLMMDRPLLYEDVKKEYSLKKFQSDGVAPGTEEQGCEIDSKKFYMLTPVLPEDNLLRQKLWNNRLELVLEINRMEREQTDFSRQCLFCKEVCKGNRFALFQHMLESHSFHIGQPDNVVFVNELLDFVEGKLNVDECIYCAKTFKDKAVLREHMRKKQHKRLNPSNRDYDKFYVINYLEPGKTWKALDEEDQEDERREEEWVETKTEETSVVCLFCSFQHVNFDTILAHMKTDHKFDFVALTGNLNFYQKVKMVNFIRRIVHLNVCLYCERKFFERTSLLEHMAQHLSSGSSTFPDSNIWDTFEYFFPTYENDQFLVLLDTDETNEMTTDSEAESVESMRVIPEDLPAVSENSFLRQEFS